MWDSRSFEEEQGFMDRGAKIWLLLGIGCTGAGLLSVVSACGDGGEEVSDLASKGCDRYTPGWLSRHVTGHKKLMRKCNETSGCMWHFDSEGNNSCYSSSSNKINESIYEEVQWMNGKMSKNHFILDLPNFVKYDYLDLLCGSQAEKTCKKSKNCKIFNNSCKFDCSILGDGFDKKKTDICTPIDGCARRDKDSCEDTENRPKAAALRRRRGEKAAETGIQFALQRRYKKEADEIKAACVGKSKSECGDKHCKWDTRGNKCQVKCGLLNSSVCKFLAGPANKSGENTGPCGYWGNRGKGSCITRDEINEARSKNRKTREERERLRSYLYKKTREKCNYKCGIIKEKEEERRSTRKYEERCERGDGANTIISKFQYFIYEAVSYENKISEESGETGVAYRCHVSYGECRCVIGSTTYVMPEI